MRTTPGATHEPPPIPPMTRGPGDPAALPAREDRSARAGTSRTAASAAASPGKPIPSGCARCGRREKSREAEDAAVRRAARYEATGDWRFEDEQPPPPLPPLHLVTGWSKADPKKTPHNPDLRLVRRLAARRLGKAKARRQRLNALLPSGERGGRGGAASPDGKRRPPPLPKADRTLPAARTAASGRPRSSVQAAAASVSATESLSLAGAARPASALTASARHGAGVRGEQPREPDDQPGPA